MTGGADPALAPRVHPALAPRLDPVLHPFLAARTDLSANLIGAVREGLNQRRRDAAAALSGHDVQIADESVPTRDGPVGVRIYRGAPGVTPVVLFCHSGAFVLGNLDTDHRQCVELAGRARCTVVSVDYRLAPEHPFPAGLDDALDVLTWVADNAGPLGVDPARCAVAGSSAGGAMAALLAQRSAAGLAPPVVFQLLHQPVLDDRTTASKEQFSTTPGFDGPACAQMWRHLAGGAPLPPEAVPARAVDLSGLPAAAVTCSELDPLRDEAIAYATRLMTAGIAVELHVVPATCHGFDSLLPDWERSQQVFALQAAALRRALHPATG